MSKPNKYSPGVRERAVRVVFEHEGDHPSQWATIRSILEKIGCTAETLRSWVRQAERDQGRRAGTTIDERARIKERRARNCAEPTACPAMRGDPPQGIGLFRLGGVPGRRPR